MNIQPELSQTQNMCITFEQRRSNVFDVEPRLTNIECELWLS